VAWFRILLDRQDLLRNWRERGKSRRRVSLAIGFVLGLGVLCGAFGTVNVSAQTATAAKLHENRWLFIVQTSSSMEARAIAVRQIAGGIVASAMNGQIQPGDTLGLWTFNKSLYTGEFRLRQWKPESGQVIAHQVFEYLKNQPCKYRGRLDAFLPAMGEVIQNSDYITVILISDGREKIHGTPFDDPINAAYRTWQDQQEKAGLPFVTVLRAAKGQITNYAVNVPPWPLELPPLPPEFQPRKPAETQAAQPPPPIAAPLIISGKKPEPQPGGQPAEPAGSTASPSTRALTNEAATPEPVPAPATAPRAGSAERPVVTAEASSRRPPPDAAPAESGRPGTDVAPRTQPALAATPVPALAAVPSEAASSPRPKRIVALGILALVAAGIALGIVYWRVRCSRSATRVSLITRSLDREKE
jgi:hypothetical protein